MGDLERSYLDIRAHRENNPLLDRMQNNLRQKIGLPLLHKKDKSAFASFDRTETAGLYSCYFTARALVASLVGNTSDFDIISREAHFLIDEVLSCNDHIENQWKKSYGNTLCGAFKDGQNALDKMFVRHIKAKDRTLRGKLQKLRAQDRA